jgi:diketogulonate reductase-like aldo/keto reductase
VHIRHTPILFQSRYRFRYVHSLRLESHRLLHQMGLDQLHAGLDSLTNNNIILLFIKMAFPSLIGFGTFDLPPVEQSQIVKQAIQTGYRIIDMAETYNDVPTGTAIRESIQSGIISRRDLYLIGKGDSGIGSITQTIKTIFQCKDEEIGTGDYYLDLFLWHHPHALYRKDYSIWDSMVEAKRRGFTRGIGVSNVYKNGLIHLLRYCDAHQYDRPIANEIEINLFNTEYDYVAFCQSHAIQVIAYSPLGYKNASIIPDLFPVISTIRKGTPYQVILAYLMQRGILVIPSSKNVSRIQENFDSQRIELSPHDMELIRTHFINNNDTITLTASDYKAKDYTLGKRKRRSKKAYRKKRN